MAQLDPIAMMKRETRLTERNGSSFLDGEPLAPGYCAMKDDEFRFRTNCGANFQYRRGEGVFVEFEPDADREEADLWFNGSVYSAVAAMNGLIPLHASALDCNGNIAAFTGPTGAGKSTLAAAFAGHRYGLFCDDTLLVQPERIGPAMCLPGHKRLKLDQQAAQLAGAQLEGKVSAKINKHYAAVTASSSCALAPLTLLVVLRSGSELQIEPLPAGETIAALLQDHYTVDFGQDAAIGGRKEYFGSVSSIVENAECVAFTRPNDISCFDDGVAMMRSFLEKRFSP